MTAASPSPTCPASSKAPTSAPASASSSSNTSSAPASSSTWSTSPTPPSPPTATTADGNNPGSDPVENYNVITAELKSFDPTLAAKPTILVATKADVANPDKLKKLTTFAKRKKLPLFTISAVTGEGIEKLKYALADAVEAHRTIDLSPPPTAPTKRKAHYPPPAPNAKGRA